MFKSLFAVVVIAVLWGCETVQRQVLPYVMDDGGGAMDVYVYDLEAGLTTTLTLTPMLDEIDPAADPMGRRIAYVARPTDARQVVFTLRIHDLQTGQTSDAVQSADPLASPAWSNDGKRIAYVVQRDGKLQIDIVELENTSKPQTITFGSSPSWRVDNRAIFFSSRDTLDAPAGDLNVHTLKTGLNQSLALRGSGFTNLPRGTSIAYTTLPYSRRNAAVWLIDANSKNRRLSSPGTTHRDTDPVHINGSKFIAFTRTDVATNQSSLYVVERYAKDPVETRLFEAQNNVYTKRRQAIE